MSDLVGILRAYIPGEPAHEEFTAERIAQAADEIERLRKQLVKASERIGDAELALAFWDEGRNSEYWLRWPTPLSDDQGQTNG